MKRYFILFMFSIILLGCKKKRTGKVPELLIYCGITMTRPIYEIVHDFERDNNCKIIITKGGSGNLKRSILTNRVGDLFLPGSPSYVYDLQKENIIIDSVTVGYNEAVIMTQKDNPKNIDISLLSLLNPAYQIVLGNPNSGSIGKETKSILKKAGIFEDAVKKSKRLTTDSKDLIYSIKNQEADMIINWFAVSTWHENSHYLSSYQIETKYATPKKLILSSLKYSKNPKLAKKFLTYAASKRGRKIFAEYGLNGYQEK